MLDRLPVLNYGAYSCKGKREENQDSLAILTDSAFYTFVVADGAGGHQYGAEAGRLAVNAVNNELENEINKAPQYIELLLRKKYEQINGHLRSIEKNMKITMLTTLSTISFIDKEAVITNIGDTKIFLIREGQINCISEVHNAAWELLDKGMINYEQYLTHDKRNVLTRALGAEDSIYPYSNIIEVNKDDIYIICSDGLYNHVSEDELINIFKPYYDNDKLNHVCKSICDTALENGSNDNITVVAVQIKEI